MLSATKVGSIIDSLKTVLSSNDEAYVHAHVVVSGRHSRHRAASIAEIISNATGEPFLLENTDTRDGGRIGDFHSESFTIGWIEES